MRAHPASLFEISTQEWGCEPGLGLCPPRWDAELLAMVEPAGVGAGPMAPGSIPCSLAVPPAPAPGLPPPSPTAGVGRTARGILQLLGAESSHGGVQQARPEHRVVLLLCLSRAQPHQSPRSEPDLLQYRIHPVQSPPDGLPAKLSLENTCRGLCRYLQ